MKKILVTAALLFAGITVSRADNDRPITLEQLPAAAQTFLKPTSPTSPLPMPSRTRNSSDRSMR